MRSRPVSFRALGAALLLGGALLAVPGLGPAPVAALGPLPACRYDDLLTIPRDYEDGPLTLVDTIFSVGKDYAPPDLVDVGKAGVAGGGLVRKIALADLTAMAKAAKANGSPIGSWSAYRSYTTQVALFNGYVKAYTYDSAVKFSARPGHSEHQLGLTIDFNSAGGGSPMKGDWSTTKAGAWMKKHAWEFGWLMSYPKGLFDTVCYSYEPWHYRYVGREVAKKIHDAGTTIREYLWANVTVVDPVTGSPLPSETPVPTASPSPTAPPASPSPVAASPVPSPSATDAPDVAAGSDLDPVTVIAGVLLVLGTIGLVVALRKQRGSRRR